MFPVTQVVSTITGSSVDDCVCIDTILQSQILQRNLFPRCRVTYERRCGQASRFKGGIQVNLRGSDRGIFLICESLESKTELLDIG